MVYAAFVMNWGKCCLASRVVGRHFSALCKCLYKSCIVCAESFFDSIQHQTAPGGHRLSITLGQRVSDR